MVMQAEKAELAVILCILYIAVVYSSDTDSKMKKLKTTETKKDYFKMAYKYQLHTHSNNFAFAKEFGVYRQYDLTSF